MENWGKSKEVPHLEQAFQDAGWTEPQQPEGELIPRWQMREILSGAMEIPNELLQDEGEEFIAAEELCKAQYTHDKARIMKS